MRNPSLVLIVLAAVAAVAAAPRAAAVPAPDSAQLVRLQAAADSAWRVKVTARRATYFLAQPRIDLSGITISSPGNPPALITAGNPHRDDKRVSWADIERVETERSAMGRGVAVGAGIGVGTGMLLVLASGYGDEGEEGWGVVALILTAATGAALGALIGMGHGISQPLYP